MSAGKNTPAKGYAVPDGALNKPFPTLTLEKMYRGAPFAALPPSKPSRMTISDGPMYRGAKPSEEDIKAAEILLGWRDSLDEEGVIPAGTSQRYYSALCVRTCSSSCHPVSMYAKCPHHLGDDQ